MPSRDELERRRAEYLAKAAHAQNKAINLKDPIARHTWEEIELGWLDLAERTNHALTDLEL